MAESAYLDDFVQKARQEADRLRSILDTAVDGIITINQRGIIESFNRAAERIFGYQAEEVIGKNINVLMPAPYQEEHDGYLQRYLSTRTPHIIGIGREVQGRRKDGTLLPIDLAVGECGSGETLRFTGFVRDITLRKKHEWQLQEQAQLLDNVQEAILICDLENRITYWNKGSERLYGWTAEEVLGENRHALKSCLNPSGKNIEELNRQVMAHGEWHGELQQTTKDGRRITVASYWTLIRDEESKPKGKLVINIDVTERKKLEAQFLRAQRLESIGVLAGGIAHDLNNVMTPILMSIKLLRKERTPEQRKELLDTAQASVERGIDMVRQLLSFGGGLEGERAVLHLSEIVAEVENMLQHTLAKTIQIQTQTENDLWTIKGDSTQLSQVLMNLCVNARDALPNGGTLTISAENVALRGDYTQYHPDAKPGPYVVLAVTDNGSGIPSEVMDKIFDPFFTTKGIGKGTGLGLSTALGIVHSHGGFLNVYSEVGKGTRVTVYLPATGINLPTETHEKITTLPQGQGKLVLLVDDEPLILRTVKEVLELNGYHAQTANNGAEAIARYQEQHASIDVVLLDMMMPEIDGPAVMHALRQINPQVRVIACSGLRSNDRVRTIFAAGAKAFLQKPYSEEHLLQTLQQVLA